MKVGDIIEDAKYLMEFQKTQLLQELGNEGLSEDEADREIRMRTFLDEFFRRVLNTGSIRDLLDTNEAAELDRLIEELK